MVDVNPRGVRAGGAPAMSTSDNVTRCVSPTSPVSSTAVSDEWGGVLQEARNLGQAALQRAHLPPDVMACMISALRRPGRLLSSTPAATELFLRWQTALRLPVGPVWLRGAVASEFLLTGYDVLDELYDCSPVPAVSDGTFGTTRLRSEHLHVTLPAGTLLLQQAQELLASLNVPAERRAKAVTLFVRAGRRAFTSHLQDVALRQTPVCVEDDRLMLIQQILVRRSGSLIGAISQCAALLAGASWRIIGHAGGFGRALGCAGQLQDDLADLAEDQLSGRQTVPVLLAHLYPETPIVVETTTRVLIHLYFLDAASHLKSLARASLCTPEPLWTLLPSAVYDDMVR